MEQACLHLPCLSFQEPLEEEDEDEKGPNPPMMVPVADILNHVANHNANLEYSPVSAKWLCQASSLAGSSRLRGLGERWHSSAGSLDPEQRCSPARVASLAWISLIRSYFAQRFPPLHVWLELGRA